MGREPTVWQWLSSERCQISYNQLSLKKVDLLWLRSLGDWVLGDWGAGQFALKGINFFLLWFREWMESRFPQTVVKRGKWLKLDKGEKPGEVAKCHKTQEQEVPKDMGPTSHAPWEYGKSTVLWGSVAASSIFLITNSVFSTSSVFLSYQKF